MGRPIFQHFPEDIMTQDAGLAVEQAVLYHNMCVDSLSTGLPLIKALLGPYCHTLKELSVRPKDPTIQVVSTNETVDVNHTVLYIRLYSNEEFVMDLTGAQYGWAEKLYTWTDYERYRGEVCYVFDLGASREFTTSLMEGHAINSAPRSGCDIRRIISHEVAQDIINYFKDCAKSVDQFMGLENMNQQRDLTMRAKDTITKAIEDLVIRSGVGRMCLLFENGISTPVVVRSEELARKLVSVWFTQEEVQACRGQFEALQLEMQHRLHEEEV
ncbi:unnamed protein product [Clonostachys chloroleuca]|uniref:Uncharacterized protein n=1 Tax=Clonostachys chloroleuca TaxID=1926264 RepID=A0AA35QF05_9HYPO|nr:unnamed protein product [Clonostachys chloroleuca]